RDFLSEWDAVEAMLALALRHAHSGARGEQTIFNLASGVQRSILDVATTMRNLMAPGVLIRCLGQERPGDPTRWHACTERLREALPQWSPQTFEDDMGRTLRLWLGETGQSNRLG